MLRTASKALELYTTASASGQQCSEQAYALLARLLRCTSDVVDTFHAGGVSQEREGSGAGVQSHDDLRCVVQPGLPVNIMESSGDAISG